MTFDEGVIRTVSPIRAWYLTKFRGLRVRAVRVTPIPTIMGMMTYSRCWVLVDATKVPVEARVPAKESSTAELHVAAVPTSTHMSAA